MNMHLSKKVWYMPELVNTAIVHAHNVHQAKVPYIAKTTIVTDIPPTEVG